MQRGALTQGTTQKTAGVPAGASRVAQEELPLGGSGQLGQTEQVLAIDWRQRPIRIFNGHSDILSHKRTDSPVVGYALDGRPDSARLPPGAAEPTCGYEGAEHYVGLGYDEPRSERSDSGSGGVDSRAA